MKTKVALYGMATLILLFVFFACNPSSQERSFEASQWKKGRLDHPDLNVSPSMVRDLMKNHLTLGMTLADVTNLLGHPEIKTPIGSGIRVRGAFLEQLVHVYSHGMHNGWLVQDTNVVLRFGERNEYLKEWYPLSALIKPVSAPESEATRETLSSGGLHLGNLRFAATPRQLETLLGPPDKKVTEYDLDYFLGRRTRLAWDETFLELHFDENQKLVRVECTEH
jgi:hypothetical protein